jgi:two-component system cell cycle sensor histidine kinase/response regulator CckA
MERSWLHNDLASRECRLNKLRANADFCPSVRRKKVTATPTLMLVDDADMSRQLMRAFLETGGYSEIIETGDGTIALDLFVNGPKRIDLLITDIMHPGMDGVDLIRAVRKIDPDIKVIVVSGQLPHNEDDVRRRLDRESNIHFLPKPYHVRVFLTMVEEVLAA